MEGAAALAGGRAGGHGGRGRPRLPPLGGVLLALYGASILLLVAVLFFGKEVGGNKSWLDLGPFAFQPSELAKWTTCLALAAYLSERGSRRAPGVARRSTMAAIAGAPMLLIARQPDMGTALTFLPIFVAALLLGGLRWRWIVGVLLVVGAILAPFGWNHLKEYQKERILHRVQPRAGPVRDRLPDATIENRDRIGRARRQRHCSREPRATSISSRPSTPISSWRCFAEEQGFLGAAGDPGAVLLPALSGHPRRALGPGPAGDLPLPARRGLARRAVHDQRRHGPGAAPDDRRSPPAHVVRRHRAARGDVRRRADRQRPHPAVRQLRRAEAVRSVLRSPGWEAERGGP